MSSNSNLQTVIITGASSGIGKATCLYLAVKGYNVIGTTRKFSRLEGLNTEAKRLGVSVHGLELDINSDTEVQRIMAEITEKFGRVYALVNNAGYGVWGPVQNIMIDDFRKLLETNLFAAIRMTQAVLPQMIKSRSGKIINISSVLGKIATPFNGCYASSKFALEGLSESLRIEVSPFNVQVAIVEPGLFKTDFQRNQLRSCRSGDVANSYKPFIERYDSQHRWFDRLASDPVKVSKVIHKIIKSKHPALRHPVGWEAHAGIMGARLLPGRLFHAMLSRATMR